MIVVLFMSLIWSNWWRFSQSWKIAWNKIEKILVMFYFNPKHNTNTIKLIIFNNINIYHVQLFGNFSILTPKHIIIDWWHYLFVVYKAKSVNEISNEHENSKHITITFMTWIPEARSSIFWMENHWIHEIKRNLLNMYICFF